MEEWAAQNWKLLVTLAGLVMVAEKGAIIALWAAWAKERKYRARIEKEFRDHLIRQNKILPHLDEGGAG